MGWQDAPLIDQQQSPKWADAPLVDQESVTPQPELGGVARAAIQGATLNWGDEAMAAVDAALGNPPPGTLGLGPYEGGYGSRYEQALGKRRKQIEQYRQQSPVLSATAELGGAIASPVNKLIGPMMAAETKLAQMGRGFGFGAAEGATAAAGGNVDPSKFYEDVAGGAAVGGVVGAAAQPLMSAVGKLAEPITNRLFNRPETVAARKVYEALQREGLTPEMAATKLQQMGPQAALMDVGVNLQGLTRALHSIPGMGKKQVDDFLRARQEGILDPLTQVQSGGQYDRVRDIVEGIVPQQYGAAKKQTVAARKIFGKDYDTARELDALVDIEPILQELGKEVGQAKGTIKQGLKRIQSLLVDDQGLPEVTIDSLHQSKMAIDDLMSGEARTSMGRVTKARIRAYQDQLVNAIESSGQAGAAYRTGRLGTAGQWRIDEALDEGRGFMLKSRFKDDVEVKDYLSKLKPEEKEAFKTGAAQHLKEKMAGTRFTANAMKDLIGTPAVEQKLRLIFGDSDFSKFKSQLVSEGEMYGTYARVRTGSPTARIEAEQSDIARDPGRLAQALRDMATGGGGGRMMGALNLAGAAGERATLSPKVSAEMAGLLTKQNIEALRQQAAQLPINRGRLASRLVTGATALGY